MKFKILAFVVAMVFFAGATPFIERTSAETIELKFSSPWPPKHPQHTKVIEPWAKKINELTNGRVKVTLFPGQALGKAKDQYDMAAKGISDISLTVPAYTPGRFQLTSVFWLPFMVTSAEDTSVALWNLRRWRCLYRRSITHWIEASSMAPPCLSRGYGFLSSTKL